MTNNTTSILEMSKDDNAYSRPQSELVDSTLRYVREAIDVLDISSSSTPLFIVNFGSAHGSNSIYAMKMIIQYLKEAKKIDNEEQIIAVHNGLPKNDWTSLFELSSEENSYSNAACGEPFYEQCLTPNTIAIGFSIASLHWLSHKPCNLSNHCVATFAQDREEREAFKHQSKLDLTSFLKHRSTELVPGGVLILNIPCVNDQDSLGFDNYVHLLYKCAKSITHIQQVLLNYTIPLYYRSFSECVDDELFAKCSFELIKVEFNKTNIALMDQYQNGNVPLDKFSKVVTSIMQSWSESSLKQALEINGQSTEEINKILDQFWILYEQEIRANPDEYIACSYYTYLILKKV
ncbi:unnamed protein product [Adineta steineri]|uniref:Uncharacterized protein n=1 Tax=Adineta steineri TaxID=433720 RepID=A0A814TA63_9BILA|nr:unnamed protein product [Adineta steineri]CAF1210784.1 unnamed protein product [Adineta steineri]